jgi:hypothetical protein
MITAVVVVVVVVGVEVGAGVSFGTLGDNDDDVVLLLLLLLLLPLVLTVLLPLPMGTVGDEVLLDDAGGGVTVAFVLCCVSSLRAEEEAFCCTCHHDVGAAPLAPAPAPVDVVDKPDDDIVVRVAGACAATCATAGEPDRGVETGAALVAASELGLACLIVGSGGVAIE